MKKIAVLGGGTGTFTVLSGLKRYDAKLSVIVSSADDGGSSGILRDELGVLPPGDVRQCLVALADDESHMRELFNYRFTDGPFAGHPIGNILLSGLEAMNGDALKGIETAHSILNVRGRVIPVTAKPAVLAVELEDGQTIEGEHAIDRLTHVSSPVKRCFLQPGPQTNPEALHAILEADMIVIGPGDLYTSLVPVLLADGIRASLKQATGQRVYVMNLTSKPGLTEGFTASRFVSELMRYLDAPGFDAVLVNAAKPAPHLVEKYESAGEKLVRDDLLDNNSFQITRASLLASDIAHKKTADIPRSLLRHDPAKLGHAIMGLALGL